MLLLKRTFIVLHHKFVELSAKGGFASLFGRDLLLNDCSHKYYSVSV